MAEEKNNIIFNISGGNNQILPNATKAEQHFYGDQFAKEALRKGSPEVLPLTDEERRLAMYVANEDLVRSYVANIKACQTAAEVGQVVATMCENEPRIDETRIVTKAFIEILVPFMTGVETGKGIDNIRNAINNAWAERKRTLRNR
jgi:hypothetical protein